MAFDISALTPKEQISLIYIGYFDRAPEPAGLNFWEIQLNESIDGIGDGIPGMDLKSIATDFSAQQETRDVYDFFDPGSTVSSGNFLTNVYLNLFGRLPDADGLNFWKAVLDEGRLEVGEIILEIIGGAQGTDITVLQNKLAVATDWHDTALANGVFIPDAAATASAASVLDGVTFEAATVVAAKAKTDTFFNTDPTLAAGSGAAVEDGAAISVDLAALGDDADSEDDGSTLTYSVTGQPSEGSASISGTDLVFVSGSDFQGLAVGETQNVTVEVTATDSNGGTAVNTVTITVTGTNDAPTLSAVTSPIAAVEDGPAIDVDLAALGADVDSDDDGSTLTYSVTGQPSEGSASITGGTPTTNGTTLTFNSGSAFQDLNEGETRDVTVEVTATDSNGATVSRDYTVTVTGTNDAPTLTAGSAATNEDGAVVAVDLTTLGDDADNENDGSTLSYTMTGAPAEGSASIVGTTLLFNPGADFQDLALGETRDVTVQITATDDQGATAVNDVTVTVTGTNDAPVAQALTLTGTVPSGLLLATDADANDTLTFAVATAPTEGTVTVNTDGSFVYSPGAGFAGTDSFTYTVSDGNGGTDTATVTINLDPTTQVLTSTVDNVQGTSANDIIRGNENTLNSGDIIDGNGGNDTLIINVNNTTGSPLTFSAFEANVETFQTTIDGNAGAVFDMSSSEITGNTFINANSRADVTYDRVNLNADGPDADARPQLDVELNNVTQGAETTFTTRPADVAGANDEANVLLVNIDNNAHAGALSFYGTPGSTDASGLEVFDLTTAGSPLGVFLDDLNTPGGNTVNIQTDVSLTIGDTTNPGDVATATSFDLVAGTSSGAVTGFDNAITNSITTVTASGTGDVALSLQDDGDTATRTNGVTGTFDGGNDVILGSDLNDTLSGGEGGDVLSGAEGNDSLLGEGGNDVLIGDDDGFTPGNDVLRGGDGDDLLLGGGGNDQLFGDADNDTILGGDGADALYGGAGTDQISTGGASDVSNEFVDAGAGDDIVHTRGEQLEGRTNWFFGGPRDVLTGSTGDDTLVVTMANGASNPDTTGMNDVTQFENIDLNDGDHTYTIAYNTAFANDSTIVTVDGSDVGKTGADSVNFNASTLSRAITLIGGDNDDTLIGGAGDDTISGDGDTGGNDGGDDVLIGYGGNDTFLTDSYELDGGDIISGGLGDDRILVQDRGGFGSSTIDTDVTSIETIEVEQNGSGDFTLNITDDFTNGGATLHVDASALTNDELNLNHNNQTEAKGSAGDVDIRATGGALNDNFRMGVTMDGDDTIDGGAGNDDALIIGSNTVLTNVVDADFANVTNVENLTLTGTMGGTVVLGQAAFDAGIRIVDASAVSGPITIDASDFPGEILIIDGQKNDTIIGPDSDAATIRLTGGDDNITLGSADDVIEIDNGELDENDIITDNGGNDTIELQNTGFASVGAVVNLDNVTGIETYDFATNGGFFFSADKHSIEFRGGNVGTVTDITVNGATIIDGNDSLEVIIGGSDNGQADVDADYAFTVTGTAGDDRLYKANVGINNQIDFDGGAGNDTVSIYGDDLGSTTTVEGGTGTDTLSQTGGVWTDDDFINVTSFEVLTAESPLVATLGAKAAAAGIVQIIGTNLNEDVTLDAAFTNDLTVDLRTGGDDTIDGGASSAALSLEFQYDSLDAGDVITGGTSADDVLNLHAGSSGTADMSNVNGVETVNLTESGGGSYELVLGNQTAALTINDSTIGNPFDGESLTLTGGAYQGDITFNSSPFSFDGASSNLTTGSGNDSIDAGAFNDTVSSGDGNDVIDGGFGNDVVDAGDDNDSIDGGSGNDMLVGGQGNDSINGGNDNDTVDGGTGIDVLDGGLGDDLIIGGGNEETPNPAVNQGDIMTGGGGADTFRFVEVSDSRGLDHDVITDWSSDDTIQIEENVLVQAGGGATSVGFAGNASNFAQAQGTIATTAGDGVADYVFQAGNAVEAPTLWIDVNDDGDLNGQDLQIELDGFTGTFAGGEVTLEDNIAPSAPTIDSITTDTAGPNGTLSDFSTSDNGTDGTQPVVRVSFDTTATDGTAARAGDLLRLDASTGTFPTNSSIGGTAITAGVGYVLTATDIANGYVDVTLGNAALANTDFTMTAEIEDQTGPFGNGITSAQASQAISIDTSAGITITSVADNDDATPTSVINTNEEGDVVVTGTVADVEDGQTVNLSFSDGLNVVNGSAVVTGGAFTTAGQNIDVSSLAEGAITVTASVTDQQGNAASTNAAATKDTTASINITGLINEMIADNIVNASEEAAGNVRYTGTSNGIEAGQAVSLTLTDQDGSPTTIGGATIDGSGNFDSFAFMSLLSTFYQQGPITVTASSEDTAGNSVTDTFEFTYDATPPTTQITSANYNSQNGRLTLNGTFNPSDFGGIAGVDVTKVTVDGETLNTDDSSVTLVSTTQIQIAISNDAFAPQNKANLDATIANGLGEVVDVAAGFLTDAAGNSSAPDNGNALSYDVRSVDVTANPMVGGALADTLEIDVAGEGATGNGGADIFHLDNIYSGGGTVIADINDFVAGTDMIQLDASDVNSVVGSSVYSSGDDGAAVAFSTFNSGVVTAATNIDGTLIFDDVNNTLRIDYNGDTSWDGATLTDVSGDDDIIDLTGINGTLTASDIFFSS